MPATVLEKISILPDGVPSGLEQRVLAKIGVTDPLAVRLWDRETDVVVGPPEHAERRQRHPGTLAWAAMPSHICLSHSISSFHLGVRASCRPSLAVRWR